MAEISREEVKKIMNSGLGCFMGKYDCVGKPCSMCEHNVSDEEVKNAMEKVISDIEKLEKIEHIVFDIGECNELTETIEEKIEKICNEYNHNCDLCMVSRIKQIVKGE